MKIILNNENLKLIEKVTTYGIKIKSENIIGYNQKEEVLISLRGNKVIEDGESNIDKKVLKYLNNKDEILVKSNNNEVCLHQNKRKIIAEDVIFF